MKSNQYPPDFYEPIIFDTWSSIVSPEIRYEDKDERAEKLVLVNNQIQFVANNRIIAETFATQ